MQEGTVAYVKTNPYENQLTSPGVEFIMDPKEYELKHWVKNEIPTRLMEQYVRWFGSEKQMRDVQRLQKVNERTKKFVYLFRHFTSNSWVFEAK